MTGLADQAAPSCRPCSRQVIELCRPLDSRLEHVDFESLFSSLSVRHLLCVFASLLLERRVIFIADKLRYQTLATSTEVFTQWSVSHRL